jgi:hypothetical protein
MVSPPGEGEYYGPNGVWEDLHFRGIDGEDQQELRHDRIERLRDQLRRAEEERSRSQFAQRGGIGLALRRWLGRLSGRS